MPIVIAQQAKKLYVNNSFSVYANQFLFLFDISEIAKKYKHMLIDRTKLQVYVSRIFNEECQVVSEPRRFAWVKLVNASPFSEKAYQGYPQASGYYVDIDALSNELSIPDGYFIEILFVSLLNTLGEKTIFPYETRILADKGIEGEVKQNMEALGKIGIISQSHSFLAGLGLKEIADELSVGYARFEVGDFDGAIKSYRKVVEGFRNHLQEKEEKDGKKIFKTLIDNSENRTGEIVEFLKKTFSMLSNFGEHYGTHAFEEEGVFANKLVEDLTEYLTKKLEKKNTCS